MLNDLLGNHFLAVLILSAIFLGALFIFSTSKEPSEEMEEEFRKRKRMFDERDIYN